jgi:ribose-phosphate pyrophosphokinase
MNKNMLVIGFSDYEKACRNLAAELHTECFIINVHYFPDGESLVKIAPNIPEHVVLCRTLDNPNAKLIELIIAAETARKLGAKRVSLVAPYLCYMRQDIEFEPGQAVSQLIIGKMLGDYFDDIITADPHLHRISHLNQAIPNANAITLTATTLMGKFLEKESDNYLLVGPDSESEQWVKSIAKDANLDYVIADKERNSDTQVNISLPRFQYDGRHALLVDDVISSGHTMMETAKALYAAKCETVSALCTHALFADHALEGMREERIETIWHR